MRAHCSSQLSECQQVQRVRHAVTQIPVVSTAMHQRVTQMRRQSGRVTHSARRPGRVEQSASANATETSPTQSPGQVQDQWECRERPE